jgi:hypothetical protein
VAWSTSEYKWSGLPPECPPGSAAPAYGRFYRFVRKPKLRARDFEPQTKYRDDIPDEKLCSASAISLFGTWEAVVEMRRWIPGFNQRKVAQGNLESSMGVIEQSPTQPKPPDSPIIDEHYDWWIPASFDPVPVFQVVT